MGYDFLTRVTSLEMNHSSLVIILVGHLSLQHEDDLEVESGLEMVCSCISVIAGVLTNTYRHADQHA